jgi:hypothetical protein
MRPAPIGSPPRAHEAKRKEKRPSPRIAYRFAHTSRRPSIADGAARGTKKNLRHAPLAPLGSDD